MKELKAIERLVNENIKSGDRFPVRLRGAEPIFIYVDSRNLEQYAIRIDIKEKTVAYIYRTKKPLLLSKGKEMFVTFMVAQDNVVEAGIRFVTSEDVEFSLMDGYKLTRRQKIKSFLADSDSQDQ